ncbi:DUF6225 family protein [uncultured Pseudonocardia sp.]|uniref:DUF6225 family protein n=1 Tax=uncultured Pseudonocardia sp. TaxID=211455 RepID=UPI002625F0F8|nr:DUF6225 family protein [uncultured Pseudonocardia sp.]
MSDDDPYNGWTVGRLRRELDGLPDDIPLLVNVSVRIPGEDGTGFLPLAITEAGFTVSDASAQPESEIMRIFNIDVEDDEGMIYVPPRPVE